jgi:hypothetical protein
MDEYVDQRRAPVGHPLAIERPLVAFPEDRRRECLQVWKMIVQKLALAPPVVFG